MNTSNAKATSFSSDEEDFPLYFSEWLKRSRQGLDLTQEQLAQRASCSVFAIRKMESGERRPSRQLAELLAKALEIPAENQLTFIQVAPVAVVCSLLRAAQHDHPLRTKLQRILHLDLEGNPAAGRRAAQAQSLWCLGLLISAGLAQGQSLPQIMEPLLRTMCRA